MFKSIAHPAVSKNFLCVQRGLRGQKKEGRLFHKKVPHNLKINQTRKKKYFQD